MRTKCSTDQAASAVVRFASDLQASPRSLLTSPIYSPMFGFATKRFHSFIHAMSTTFQETPNPGHVFEVVACCRTVEVVLKKGGLIAMLIAMQGI